MRLDATPIGVVVQRPGMNGRFYRGGVAGPGEHYGRILARSVLSGRAYWWPCATDVEVVEP